MKTNTINLDITHRCRLQCPKCMRTKFSGLHKRGSDISLDNMKKISLAYHNLLFCGQMGDPIYHPQFDKIMEMCKNNNVQISTNGSGKSIEWFEKIHYINKNIKWIFGVDGLPKDSNKYRIGQDGISVFEVMKRLSSIGANVTWQFIVFKYNENDIEKAEVMSKQFGIKFLEIHSSRWDENDEFRPTNPKNYHIRPKVFEGI